MSNWRASIKRVLAGGAIAILAGGIPYRAAEPRVSAEQNPEEAPLARALGYQIGPEDVLHISVWRNDTLSRTVPVRPDGMISLPLLNDVPASGLTPLELRERLAKRLVEYIPQPEVSVIVTEVRSFKVSVMGQVFKPGRYTLGSWATVADVLALGGGLTGFAARSRITVVRGEGRSVRKIPFNYDKLATGEQANFYVRPGDVVLVP